MTSICSVDGCDRRADARGLCKKHWRRWRRNGDPGEAADRRPGIRPFTAAQWVGAFWAKVDRAGDCWLWTGARQSMGYGMYSDQPVHRVARELTYGPIPNGLFVCHACDRPACVNPAHLLLGTQLANITDAQRKGRIRSGEAHSDAKLTAETAAIIRAEHAAGVGYRRLANRYGVAMSTVQAVIQGRTWKRTLRFEEDR
jgi:hypothetical protein